MGFDSGIEKSRPKRLEQSILPESSSGVPTEVVESISADERRKAISRLCAQAPMLEKTIKMPGGFGRQVAELAPKISALLDKDRIEDQQIDIIKNTDGTLRASFKLTERYYRAMLETFDVQERGVIAYRGNSRSGVSHELIFSEALTKRVEGAIVRISTATKDDKKGKKEVRCGLGLVEIMFDKDIQTKQAIERIDHIMESNFNIASGLREPDQESENAYKRARYEWHHKTTAPDGVENRLTREEVVPGYLALVEKGKSQEYRQRTNYAAYHQFCGATSITAVILAGGLLSTNEKFRRNLYYGGPSSRRDLETGGGDGVYTRVITQEGIEKRGKDPLRYGDSFIVFEPDILDRIDWYAYRDDRYGSTEPDTFKDRLSPEELLGDQPKDFTAGQNGQFNALNEQIFRTGIGVNKFRAIVYRDVEGAIDAMESITAAGITEINGKPVVEFILVTDRFDQFIAISKDDFNGVQKLADILKARENPAV